MKHFSIKFDLDNEAFSDNNEKFEISRILKNVARRINQGDYDTNYYHQIKDINGNTIGHFFIEE